MVIVINASTKPERSALKPWGLYENRGSSVARNDRLYALDLKHVLHVRAVADGKEIARLPLPDPAHAFVQPVGATGLLFGTRKGDQLLATIP